MSAVLVKVSADYADEFQCEEFKVFTQEEFNKFIEYYKNYFDENNEAEIYFGTNEFLIFESFTEFYDCLSVSEITDEEASVIQKLFGDYSFGTSGVFSVDY